MGILRHDRTECRYVDDEAANRRVLCLNPSAAGARVCVPQIGSGRVGEETANMLLNPVWAFARARCLTAT
jgi:hypothetical protein